MTSMILFGSYHNQWVHESNSRIEWEVNTDETKYMVMSPFQNAGQSHNIKTDNSSFEGVEECKYLEQS
jgi:hypothetical protein